MVEKGGNLVQSNEKITITAEHVVTATGNHAQRTAALLGIKIPAIPVEHQFIVTEPDEELVKFRELGNSEHPVLGMQTLNGMYVKSEVAGSWTI